MMRAKGAITRITWCSFEEDGSLRSQGRKVIHIHRTLTVFGVCAAVPLAVTDSVAQVPRMGPRDYPTCRRPAHSPVCAQFWITEVVYAARFADSTTLPAGRSGYLTLEGGAMVNRGNKAFGAGVYYGGHFDGRRWGIKPRMRWWLGRDVAFDLMPGLVLGGRDHRAAVSYPGGTLAVAVELDGWAALTGGVELVRRAEGGTFADWHVGARAGGEYGAILGITMAVLVWFVDGLLGVFGSTEQL